MTGRLPSLDGLRAIAILIVMISHAGFSHIVPGGLGVTIFFFLSGYLITTMMVVEWDRMGQFNFGGFYLRRAVRIIPPMLIAIGATVLLALIGYMRPLNYTGLAWDLLFLTNYTGDASNVPIPLWSLDVEEHFYLLFPLIFFLVRRNHHTTTVALACLLLCGVVLATRVATVIEMGPTESIYYWSHTRIDSILFGCVLACWNNPATGDRPRIRGQIGFAVLGAILILATLVIRDELFRETLRYSIQGVGLFLIFNFALRDTGLVARALSSLPLKIVADLSYFLYLIHLPMLIFMSHFAGSVSARYAAAITLSFLFAALVRQYVELPLLRWRKRVEPKPSVKVSTV